MNILIYPVKRLNGELDVPGDKSISHRSIMLGALALGTTRVKRFLMAGDCLTTISAFNQMGIVTDITDCTEVIVYGQGIHGLNSPAIPIDAGNSGTTARLLLGLLSGQSFRSFLTGDASLSKRPMARVVLPLRRMGAAIDGCEDGRYLPLSIKQSRLTGIEYHMPVASAQVKSALILATLYADSPTTIHQPAPCRDHTEVMLRSFGAKIDTFGTSITAYPTHRLDAQDIEVPGDISSAAFFITGGLLIPGSSVTIKRVGLNPTRTGILDVYRNMGADILIENTSSSGGESYGDITVKSSALKGTSIGGNLIPRLIDEIPAIALAATQAQGTTVILDAQELKVKESNRINSVVSMLSAMGADISATDDGMIINGPTPLNGAVINPRMDHRIAMTAAIAGMIASGETTIESWEWVDISFPGFYQKLKELEC